MVDDDKPGDEPKPAPSSEGGGVLRFFAAVAGVGLGIFVGGTLLDTWRARKRRPSVFDDDFDGDLDED